MSANSDEKTKCLRCGKLYFEGQNWISCDECSGWLHIRCAGIKLKEFDKICSDEKSTFVCRYCQYYKCGKCVKPVYPLQNGLVCDIDECQKWFHLGCTQHSLADYKNSKSHLRTNAWYCPDCTSLPFENLNDKDFLNTITPDLNVRVHQKLIPCINFFKQRCSVCCKNITKNQKPKSLPCVLCSTLVHRKCSNITLSELLKTKSKHLKNWSCNSCMSLNFPFQDIDCADVLKLSFNSLVFCPCLKESTETPLSDCIEFKTTNDMYDTDTIFTHAPDPHNHMNNTLDINSCCDYTNHDFHKLASELKNSKTKPFSVFHTNIESLSHNFDSLERLCTDLNYPFDIIAVTETWNPSSKKDNFIPKRLENYQKYNGLPGESMKSGCGLYIHRPQRS